MSQELSHFGPLRVNAEVIVTSVNKPGDYLVTFYKDAGGEAYRSVHVTIGPVQGRPVKRDLALHIARMVCASENKRTGEKAFRGLTGLAIHVHRYAQLDGDAPQSHLFHIHPVEATAQ